MPRCPRFFIPDVPSHVIQRGNNRCACFHTDADRALYMNKLAYYSSKFDVAIHSYVLMTNHVHLLVTPSDTKGLSRCMQALGSCYVVYFNKLHERTGTLWEGRFRASIVDSERYFYTLCRYIELNPVRAGMVHSPMHHTWSSHQMNAGDRDIELLTPHPLYLALGKNNEERKKAYRTLFQFELTQTELETIRSSTNKCNVIGDDDFRKAVEARLRIRLPAMQHGGVRRARSLTP